MFFGRFLSFSVYSLLCQNDNKIGSFVFGCHFSCSHLSHARAPPIWNVTQGRDFCTSYWIIIFTIMLMNLDYRVSKWSYEKQKLCFLVKKANKLIQIALFYPGWVRRMPTRNYWIFRAGTWKMGNIVQVSTQIFPAADTSNLHIFQKEFEKIFQ